MKTVDIRTRIVGVEGERADHQTATESPIYHICVYANFVPTCHLIFRSYNLSSACRRYC